MAKLLTSNEAAALLGVSRATLYAYVSRGLVRSQGAPDGRHKQYLKEDIDRLLAIKAGRRDPRKAAAGALSWGDPVLDSAITLIRDDRLYYRGEDVEQLAARRSFEEVAGLLWLDDPAAGPGLFAETAADLPDALHQRLSGLQHLDPIRRIQAVLPAAAAADPQAYAGDPQTAARVGARIIGLMTAVIAAGSPGENARGTIAERLAQAWEMQDEDPARGRRRRKDPGLSDPGGTSRTADLLNTALVLIADHELNVSSFTVRCAASAGAGLYAALNAGLSALGGSLHGGATDRVEVFLDEAARVDDPAEAVRARLGRGDFLQGFGHNLYSYDPRARILLKQTAACFPGHPEVERAAGLVEAVRAAGGPAPTVDLGLVTLRRAAGLPRGAALSLFALGRAAGWVGHAIEQIQTGRLIRPRARYVGKQARTQEVEA